MRIVLGEGAMRLCFVMLCTEKKANSRFSCVCIEKMKGRAVAYLRKGSMRRSRGCAWRLQIRRSRICQKTSPDESGEENDKGIFYAKEIKTSDGGLSNYPRLEFCVKTLRRCVFVASREGIKRRKPTFNELSALACSVDRVLRFL